MGGLELRTFEVPLKVRFREVDRRAGVLVRGDAGWGEFSPFPDYAPEAASRWAAAALEAATSAWPEPVRESVPVNVTIPAVSAERAYEMTTASGCSTAKVKVADGDDEQRVAAVRDALGPTGKIRIDVNGKWSVRTATAAVKRLSVYDLEYVEQPVATLEEMTELRKKIDIPLAVDESIRTAEDPLRVAGLEAADIVVLKVQPLGGVRRALEVAEACGLAVVASSALDTSIGIAAGLALAAALPELPYACGLGTVLLLKGDVVAEPLIPVDGSMSLRRPTVDEAALAAYETFGAQRDAQLARFEAARALLGTA